MAVKVIQTMHSSAKQPVMVLDGNTKQALTIVRSLGAQGVPVYCGAERGTAMAGHSRHATKRFVYPSPKSDQVGFVAAVEAVAAETGAKPLVYACSDATICTLYAYRDQLADGLVLNLPEDHHFEIAFDNGATYSQARVSGVPTITTYIREQRAEVEQLANELSFPVVIKPRHSVSWNEGVGVFETASFMLDKAALLQKYDDLYQQTGEAPLIQPFVQGEEYGVELLVEAGKVRAEVVHHRIRSMSPRGGASVVKETVPESELVTTMRDHAYTLAEVLNWTGPFMVEFKVHADSREAELMEINGRWWGSLPLAVAAGVDFPYLYYRMVTGETVSAKVVQATPGCTTRHWLGDVRHLLRVWLARDPMRQELYPKRLKALKDFFRNPKDTTSDVWRWTDPLPGIMEYIDVFMKFVVRN